MLFVRTISLTSARFLLCNSVLYVFLLNFEWWWWWWCIGL